MKNELPINLELDLNHAYDGSSKRRPRRALYPLERDILCRIITDLLAVWRHDEEPVKIRWNLDEIPILVNIRDAIDPRND